MSIPTDDSKSESMSPAASSLFIPSGPCSPDIVIPPRPTSAPASTAAEGIKRPAEEDQALQGVPVLVCQTKLGDRDHRSKKILSKDPCPEMNRLASRRM